MSHFWETTPFFIKRQFSIALLIPSLVDRYQEFRLIVFGIWVIKPTSLLSSGSGLAAGLIALLQFPPYVESLLFAICPQFFLFYYPVTEDIKKEQTVPLTFLLRFIFLLLLSGQVTKLTEHQDGPNFGNWHLDFVSILGFRSGANVVWVWLHHKSRLRVEATIINTSFVTAKNYPL